MLNNIHKNIFSNPCIVIPDSQYNIYANNLFYHISTLFVKPKLSVLRIGSFSIHARQYYGTKLLQSQCPAALFVWIVPLSCRRFSVFLRILREIQAVPRYSPACISCRPDSERPHFCSGTSRQDRSPASRHYCLQRYFSRGHYK